MPIDRSRLTKDEREELRRALLGRRAELLGDDRAQITPSDIEGWKWRVFIIETLLSELGH